MNWNELKEFCNSLNDEQLEQKVIMWREDAEDVITEISSIQLKEDYYIEEDSNEDGCFPEWQAKSQINDDPESYPEGMEHFKKVYDKGHPILCEEI
jgi:hypothetical protein